MRNNTIRSRAEAAGALTYEGRPMLCGHTTRRTESATCAICPTLPKAHVRSIRDGARQRALANGDQFYQGAPCKHGHSGKRYTSKSQCYECQMQFSAARDHATDHVRERRQAWRKANPYANMAIGHRAHSVARGSTCDGTVTAAYLEALLSAQNNGCAYCGRSETLTLDHKTPLARGGTHTATNVQWLCRAHNSSKADQTDAEYRDKHLIADITPWDAL